MSVGRPRKINKDLPPGLFCYPGRNCYIRLGEMRPVDLHTKDKAEALAIYWEFRRAWDMEQASRHAESITTQLQAAAKGCDRLTVAGYAENWRKTKLPTLAKPNGKLLSKKTRADYARMLKNQVEKFEPFKTIALSAVTTKDMRQFLAQWIDSPHHYNYTKSLLSRMLQFSVDEGLLDSNPIDSIRRRPVAKRDVYMPNDHYVAITAKMTDFEARACDLLYLISHRPKDVLSLKDAQIDGNIIRFTASKNDVDMEIEMNEDLAETIRWVRDRKTEQGIVSPHLVVYPTSSKRRHIGKPLSAGYLSRKFADAVIAAGLTKGKYTLRDIRPKGLTDEFLVAGDSDKGGHKTEAMKQHYRRVRLPMRAKNNLRRIRG